ncbi:MAG: alpha/beta hydrolase [Propionibacteriaceae bacterium]|nr:alpha/beta hydrolase [Propionibacteriaceae bacterium]
MSPRRAADTARPIADDALGAVQKFHQAGAVSFHHFDIPEVREKYRASCAANALTESSEPDVTDHDVADFRVRVYEPRPQDTRTQPTPVVLFLHGGGWLMGDLDTHHSGARRLAVQSGFPVVAVDYRLAPEHPYPAAVDDCRQALRWLSDAGQPHGVTATSISILGDSAGGQLAAVLSNEFHDDPSVAPLCSQVLLYPIVDITRQRMSEGASYRRVSDGFPLVAGTMRWFVDTYVPEDQDRSVPDLSPLLHELPEGLPPALVITVDNDPLADEGGDYAAALARAGCDVTYRHLRGYHHGLFTSAGAITRGEQEFTRIADFLRATAF